MNIRFNKDKFDTEILLKDSWISLSGIIDAIAFYGKDQVIDLAKEEYGEVISKELNIYLETTYERNLSSR